MIDIPCKVMPGCEDLPLPQKMSPGASGYDLFAAVMDPVVLKPGERAVIPTGISLEIPLGYEAQVRPRSGLALKYGITLVNAPGTIDADFRGEIGVLLVNLGQDVFYIRRGDRIAQLVLAPVLDVHWVKVHELRQTERGSGGFGHSGV